MARFLPTPPLLVISLLLLLLLLASIPSSSSAAAGNKSPPKKPKSPSSTPPPHPHPHPSSFLSEEVTGVKRPSSAVFPIYGNVYPHGLYYVSISIGNPPKPYFLDVDTGSDLTWLQCDAPCVSCSKGPHPVYRPRRNGLVPCKNPLCVSVHESTHHNQECESVTQCDYEIQYADHWSSLGVVVSDAVAVRLTNSSLVRPRLAFGCGYDQQGTGANSPSATDGILGLGSGAASIISQLRDQGVTKNVIGHCLSRSRGGYLFFGDDLVPPRGMTWAPMSRISPSNYYSPGKSSFFFSKQSLGIKEEPVVFDSGSSYTYFTNQPYQAFVTAIGSGGIRVYNLLNRHSCDERCFQRGSFTLNNYASSTTLEIRCQHP